MKSYRRRSRCASNWKNIIIFGRNGEENKEFPLDNYGNLLQKLPPKKRRKFKDYDTDDSFPNQELESNEQEMGMKIPDDDLAFEDQTLAFHEPNHFVLIANEEKEIETKKENKETSNHDTHSQQNQSGLNLRFNSSISTTENTLEFQDIDQDDATSEAYITDNQGVFYD